MKSIVFILCLIMMTEAVAQTQLDSIKAIAETAVDDSIKVEALIAWDNLIYLTAPELDVELNQRIVSLCTNKSTAFFQKNLSTAKNNLGVVFLSHSELDLALESFNEGLKIAKRLKDTIGIINGYGNVGLTYNELGNYPLALKNQLTALGLELSIKDSLRLASTLNNIGQIYHNQKEYDLALQYFEQSRAIDEKTNNNHSMLASLNNIGVIYKETYKDILALEKFKDCQELAEKLSRFDVIYSTLLNQAIIFNRNGESVKALGLCERALSIAIQNNDLGGQANALINGGMIMLSTRNHKKGIAYCLEAKIISDKTGVLLDRSHACKCLYDHYKETGQTQKALEALESYMMWEDSLTNTSRTIEIARREAAFKYEKQIAADSLLLANESALHQADLNQLALQKEQNKKQRQIGMLLTGGILLLVLSVLLITRSYFQKRKVNTIISAQKEEVALQKTELEIKNKEITDSISYAKIIQGAILPDIDEIQQSFKDIFVLYEPKDIVSGDFYWFEKNEDFIYIAVADCTGHGVPGAMVSMVCNNALNQAVKDDLKATPSAILEKVRNNVAATFIKDSKTNEKLIRDGMDIAFCKFHRNKQLVEYAGANNDLYLVRNGLLMIYKSCNQPIGHYEHIKDFENHQIQLLPDDTIYLFSDGYADQFGGPKGKKFKVSQFRKLLCQIAEDNCNSQKGLLQKHFLSWKGDMEQIDDICIIGIGC